MGFTVFSVGRTLRPVVEELYRGTCQQAVACMAGGACWQGFC